MDCDFGGCYSRQLWEHDQATSHIVMIVGTPYSPPPEPRKNQSDSKATKKWLLGGSTKVTQKRLKSDFLTRISDSKVTKNDFFGSKGHFLVTFESLWWNPPKFIFLVTLESLWIFSGFRGAVGGSHDHNPTAYNIGVAYIICRIFGWIGIPWGKPIQNSVVGVVDKRAYWTTTLPD